MQHDEFTFDGVGVDRAPVLALVLPAYVTDLQVPFFDVRSDDAESGVVHDSSFLVRQRNRVMVEPGNLQQQ